MSRIVWILNSSLWFLFLGEARVELERQGLRAPPTVTGHVEIWVGPQAEVAQG